MLSLRYRIEPGSSGIRITQFELRAPDVAVIPAHTLRGLSLLRPKQHADAARSGVIELVIALRREMVGNRVLLREGAVVLSRDWDDDPLYPMALDGDGGADAVNTSTTRASSSVDLRASRCPINHGQAMPVFGLPGVPYIDWTPASLGSVSVPYVEALSFDASFHGAERPPAVVNRPATVHVVFGIG